jgi:hypothetical protein
VRPYLEKLFIKRAGREAQGREAEFKPHYCKKKKCIHVYMNNYMYLEKNHLNIN